MVRSLQVVEMKPMRTILERHPVLSGSFPGHKHSRQSVIPWPNSHVKYQPIMRVFEQVYFVMNFVYRSHPMSNVLPSGFRASDPNPCVAMMSSLSPEMCEPGTL